MAISIESDPFGSLNKPQELEIAKNKLMREFPKFSCTFAREKLFYLKKHEQIELYIKGLKIAGISDD